MSVPVKVRQALGSFAVGCLGVLALCLIALIVYAGYELHAIYNAIVVGHSHTYNLLVNLCHVIKGCVVPKGNS